MATASDLPLRHWLYIAALFPIGATLGVAFEAGRMLGGWVLRRADRDVMQWVEVTDQ